MKVIVGLGNPGSKYAATRHNVGFEVIDLLARRCGVDLTTEKFQGWFARCSIGDQEAVLLKPSTFMNRSGQAVLATGRFYRIEMTDLLVVYDDLALPLGKLRLRASGSAGGHNGMQDIIDRLGTEAFARLRVGIDPPAGDPVSYVLSPFSEAQAGEMARACRRAGEAVECWVGQGIEAAMNRYNSEPDREQEKKD